MLPAMDDAGIDPFWALIPAEAVGRIGTTEVGLSAGEAAERQTRFGPDIASVHAKKRLPAKSLRRLSMVAVAAMRISVPPHRRAARSRGPGGDS